MAAGALPSSSSLRRDSGALDGFDKECDAELARILTEDARQAGAAAATASVAESLLQDPPAIPREFGSLGRPGRCRQESAPVAAEEARKRRALEKRAFRLHPLADRGEERAPEARAPAAASAGEAARAARTQRQWLPPTAAKTMPSPLSLPPAATTEPAPLVLE